MFFKNFQSMNPPFLKIILLNAVLTTLTFVKAQRDDKEGE
jgi:hypothetical protein